MKKVLAPTKIVAMRNYLLCELLSNKYISTQQTAELSKWLDGYGLLPKWQFVDQLYQEMCYLKFCLVLLLLLGVCLLSIIPSQCEALQTKQSPLAMQILDISTGLFCKGNILVDPNNPLLSLAENLRCLYNQYRILLDAGMSGVCMTSLNNRKNGTIPGGRGWHTFFSA